MTDDQVPAGVPPVEPPSAVAPPSYNPYYPNQQGPYGYGPQPGQAPGGVYSPQPRTNTLAIVSLILAFFVSLAAVICGHIALSQIKRTGEGGRGLALAGVIIGYVGIGLSLVIVVVYAIIIISVIGTAGAGIGSFNGINS
jgi:peptidyl-prolyl cis-trans isomerase B (cyclophilin B)